MTKKLILTKFDSRAIIQGAYNIYGNIFFCLINTVHSTLFNSFKHINCSFCRFENDEESMESSKTDSNITKTVVSNTISNISGTPSVLNGDSNHDSLPENIEITIHSEITDSRNIENISNELLPNLFHRQNFKPMKIFTPKLSISLPTFESSKEDSKSNNTNANIQKKSQTGL